MIIEIVKAGVLLYLKIIFTVTVLDWHPGESADVLAGIFE